MDRLQAMAVFIAVAEEQGFAAAARRLRMSPPAVTRTIAALEQRLGVKLLARTTRFVRATEAGLHYLDSARRLLADADEADETAAGSNAAPRGHLTVTAPVLFGRMFVMPSIVSYLRDFPDTTLSALFLDRTANLVEEGIDVGVRIGELPDSSMKAIRVGSVCRVLCAAPLYLKQHGVPQQPADLAAHTMIATSGAPGSGEWHFNRGSRQLRVRVAPRLIVPSNDAAIDAALCGLGIARALSYQIAPHLASGKLKLFLREFEPVSLPIHVVHRESRHGSVKVRTFVDLLVDNLRAEKIFR